MTKKAQRPKAPKAPATASLSDGVLRTRVPPTVRYAAFLRGVSPMNLKMPDLERCFVQAGFYDVQTVLSSGNVVFSAPRAPNAALELQAETAMSQSLARSFLTIVRPIDALRTMLAANPYENFPLPAGAKRVVTFVKHALGPPTALPIELHDARILCLRGQEVFTDYVPGARAAAFMRLIEKTFGKDVTTRTWDTVRRVAR